MTESLDRSALLQVPGARLALHEIGPIDGHPLLVLHGGPGEAHDVLRPHLDALATAQRRVVYYDQRGGGESRLEAGAPYAGIREHAGDVEHVRRHLRAEYLDLLGFSWGALLAVAYAAGAPDRVRRLVLVSPPALDGRDDGAQARLARARTRPAVAAVLAEYERRIQMGDGAARMAHQFATRVAPVLHDPDAVRRLAPVAMDEAARDAAEQSCRGLLARLELTALRDMPTLVVSGADDPVALPDAPTRRLPWARSVVLESCGHAPFVETPDAFVRAVKAFLDEN